MNFLLMAPGPAARDAHCSLGSTLEKVKPVVTEPPNRLQIGISISIIVFVYADIPQAGATTSDFRVSMVHTKLPEEIRSCCQEAESRVGATYEFFRLGISGNFKPLCTRL